MLNERIKEDKLGGDKLTGMKLFFWATKNALRVARNADYIRCNYVL